MVLEDYHNFPKMQLYELGLSLYYDNNNDTAINKIMRGLTCSMLRYNIFISMIYLPVFW